MQRVRDIGAGTILGVVLMLSLISWSEGAGIIAALILGLALQGLALYVAVTKMPGTPKDEHAEPPMKRATVRFGGKRVTFPPAAYTDDEYIETGATTQ
jgi:hypothetical protein